MARSSKSNIPWAGVALGGIVAGLALPRLLQAFRTATRAIGAKAYTSGVPAIGRATADPAQGRPA